MVIIEVDGHRLNEKGDITTIPENVKGARSNGEGTSVEFQLEESSGEISVAIVETGHTYTSKSVSYVELWRVRRKAYANGKWRFLKDEDRGLLNSAIEYLKFETRIVSVMVIARLRVVMSKLGTVKSARILKDGEIRAMEMRTQYRDKGMFEWVPQLKRWLNDVAYNFWLGMMHMSLEEFCPMVRASTNVCTKLSQR